MCLIFSEKVMPLTLMLLFPKFMKLLTNSLICLRAESVIAKHKIVLKRL